MNSLTPISEIVLNSGLAMFTKVSGVMAILVSAIFIMRIVALQARLAGPSEYGSLLKDVIYYFAMLSLFPFLVKLIYGVSEGLATKIYYIPLVEAESKLQEFLTLLFYNDTLAKVSGHLGTYFIIYFAQGLYSIFTGLLLSIAPVFIFMATILGFEKGLGFYFNSIISISLWPVLWNLLGLLGNELFKSIETSTISVVVYWVLIHVLQLVSPIFCIAFINNLSASGAAAKVVATGVKLGGRVSSPTLIKQVKGIRGKL